MMNIERRSIPLQHSSFKILHSTFQNDITNNNLVAKKQVHRTGNGRGVVYLGFH